MISLSLLLGCLWVLCATATAFLPMRRQFAPGIALLISAPLILGFIGYQHGLWIAALGFAAFVSMFRNPLRYYWKRALGQAVEMPK